MFQIKFTHAADAQFKALTSNPAKVGLVKQISKSLGFLATKPKHPSLNTHEYHSIAHPWDSKGKVFEAYAQHKTPSAYRIFWCYGPQKGEITIIAITPHP